MPSPYSLSATPAPYGLSSRPTGVAAAYAPSDPVLDEVGALYPRLRQHLPQTTVRRGRANDGRQLEFYPPWERDNPNPGRITVEIFNQNLRGRDLSESIGLDMLHHIGGRDPQGEPVDPEYYALKQEMARAVRSANRRMDTDAWQQDRRAGLAGDSYDDWLEQNRVDAYIRGYVSPRMNPEWRQPGTFTPEMSRAGERIRQYLQGEPR